jgi:nitrous oxide reductase
MSHWIDPKFDPLEELHQTKQKLAHLESNFMQLVMAHNKQAELIKQIYDQNTQLLEMWNNTLSERLKRL